MREILFRGKCKTDNKWLYGFPYVTRKNAVKINWYCSEFGSMRTDEVDPETVGQYTGLTDKNGVRIFEGDILKAFGYIYVIMWDSIRAMFYLRDPVYRVTSDFYNYCGSDLSVIGNIHDNLEILKGGGDNG